MHGESFRVISHDQCVTKNIGKPSTTHPGRSLKSVPARNEHMNQHGNNEKWLTVQINIPPENTRLSSATNKLFGKKIPQYKLRAYFVGFGNVISYSVGFHMDSGLGETLARLDHKSPKIDPPPRASRGGICRRDNSLSLTHDILLC